MSLFFHPEALPNRAQSAWKYSDLSLVAKTPWQEMGDFDVPDLARYKKPGICLFWVNGHYDAKGSSVLPEEVTLVCQKASWDLPFIHCSQATQFTLDIEGQLSSKIHLIEILTEQAQHCFIPLIFRLHLKANAQADIHWHFFSPASLLAWQHSRMEITLAQKACLKQSFRQQGPSELIRWQELDITQQSDSHYQSMVLLFGAKLERMQTQVHLIGEKASATLRGFYQPQHQEQSCHFILVNHQAPNTISEQYYKGTIDDQAQGVFQSQVVVQKGADGSVSQQTNKNLLLSHRAEIDTQPDLEIYADQVQCTHGATVGDLDDQALFYLSARGIPKEKARQMLIDAFSADILALV